MKSSALVIPRGNGQREIAGALDEAAKMGRYRGGVQPNTSATTILSRRWDKLIKDKSRDVSGVVSDEAYWQPRMSREEVGSRVGLSKEASRRIPGFTPDGGVYTRKDDAGVSQILSCVEAKYQGVGGNAVERSFKNDAESRMVGSALNVIFCLGDGFYDDNAPGRIIELAVMVSENGVERVNNNDVWNKKTGNLWVFRYHSIDEATDVSEVIFDSVLYGLKAKGFSCPVKK